MSAFDDAVTAAQAALAAAKADLAAKQAIRDTAGLAVDVAIVVYQQAIQARDNANYSPNGRS